MWDAAFQHGRMFQLACQYSAMFSPLKLRMLAKLNLLPSWWFFREFVVKGLPGFGVEEKKEEWLQGDSGECRFFVDDSEMMAAWGQAALFCRGVEAKQSIERRKDVSTTTEAEGFFMG